MVTLARNQVDGLPLIVHNTRAVVVELPPPSNIRSGDDKMYVVEEVRILKS